MDNFIERGGFLHWVRNGSLVVDRPFFGAEKILLNQLRQTEEMLVQSINKTSELLEQLAKTTEELEATKRRLN